MLFRKKLLVLAVALSSLSLPTFAEITLEKVSIVDSESIDFDRTKIEAPFEGLKIKQGEPIPLSFVQGNRDKLRTIEIGDEELAAPSGVYAGDRFIGYILGATEISGPLTLQFVTYSWMEGSRYHQVDIEVIKSDSSPEPSETPTLDITSPTDGQSLQQGDPLNLTFTVPDKQYRMTSVTAGGQPLNINWDYVQPGSRFGRQFYGFTDTSGELSIRFNFTRVADGQTFSVEKKVNVLGSETYGIELTSPVNYSHYNKGDLMPVEAIPSSWNREPRFVAFVGEEYVGEMTKAPYRLDYLVTQDEGSANVRVVEYTGENSYVDEKSVQVQFFPSAKQAKARLKIKEGVSAIEEGTSATLAAEVQGFNGKQPIPTEQFIDKVAAVEFYVNDELVLRDETAPYEFTRVYDNNKSSFDDYGTFYSIKTRVEMKDKSFDVVQAPVQKVEAVPLGGVNYCKSQALVWNAQTEYTYDDKVQFEGFFYTSNGTQSGITPSPETSQYDDNFWTQILCSEQIAPQTMISVLPKGSYRAQIGQTIDIEGRAVLRDDFTLEELIKQNSSGQQVTLPYDDNGNFSFEHLFEGQDRCFGEEKCDSIDIYAINSIQYPNKVTITVKENASPIIDYAYATLYGKEIAVNFYGRDDSDRVTVKVFDRQGGKLLASETINTRPSFPSRSYAGVLTFDESLQAPRFYFEVEDESGAITSREITVYNPSDDQ